MPVSGDLPFLENGFGLVSRVWLFSPSKVFGGSPRGSTSGVGPRGRPGGIPSCAFTTRGHPLPSSRTVRFIGANVPSALWRSRSVTSSEGPAESRTERGRSLEAGKADAGKALPAAALPPRRPLGASGTPDEEQGGAHTEDARTMQIRPQEAE